MLLFLGSNQALNMYTNSPQILAAANLYNLHISVFSYGDGEEQWTEIKPDLDIAGEFEVKLGKLLPDMAVYHSVNTHFDLLIKDSFRVNQFSSLVDKMNIKPHSKADENSLYKNNFNNLEDELFLAKEKKNGFKRISPITTPESISSKKNWLTCDVCQTKLESSGLLIAHKKATQLTSLFHVKTVI